VSECVLQREEEHMEFLQEELKEVRKKVNARARTGSSGKYLGVCVCVCIVCVCVISECLSIVRE